MEKLLVAQIIAHIIADFYLQPERMVAGKRARGFRSGSLYLHVAIVGAMSLLAAFRCDFILFAALIAAAHLLIDALKIAIEKRWELAKSPALFLGDQLLHVGAICFVVFLYGRCHAVIPGYLDFFSVRTLLVAGGGLLCLKPANVVIRCCLSSLELTGDETPQDKTLARAGRWIGSIERLLAFAMMLLGQYTAIGFIIAAKSVLRFGEKDTHKAEYVLVGTLLSFGIAVLLAVGIGSLIRWNP